MDYRSTVFLPKTNFPMRANLSIKEQEILGHWQKIDLFQKLRSLSKGRKKFILHDGPPYANGHIHIGHALNKILKDVVNRSQQMLGKDVYYIPGWDCHGLPIEWQIEQNYRKKGIDKDKVPVLELRKECRDSATNWIKIQKEEFIRLGVLGDWDNSYTTMDLKAEAQIAKEISKFLFNGALYRTSIPVLWSVVEKTALAEAELEYHDHTSQAIFVKFPIQTSPILSKNKTFIVIWTTTPWTLPGNRAIGYGADIDYAVIDVKKIAENSRAIIGEKLVIAVPLLDSFAEVNGIIDYKILEKKSGKDFKDTICHHPLYQHGYDFPVPLLPGDFVTTDQGTGFVHIAPGHGLDDYQLGCAHNIPVPQTVAADGSYYDDVPLFAGKKVLYPNGKEGNANNAVIEALMDQHALLAHNPLVHSYPHSWRSKAPLIFRNTPQWFISMEKNGLREKALHAIEHDIRFIPEQGKRRLYSMIDQRPDWCISRQRAWGVPIPLFLHKKTQEILKDQKVMDRIVDIFGKEGSDSWFNGNPQRFLGSEYSIDDYDQVMDIVDVWFESGTTHSFVLESRADLEWPSSLYLEGSDQHRGWFNSSLLESCGTRGKAPYKAVLTHGFALDEMGRKMSKSLGNVVSPHDVIKQYGADILRLWIMASDYAEDLRIGPEILKQQAELYRKLRNTLRYLLGALENFDPKKESVKEDQMPELEQWVLHRLYQIDQELRYVCENFTFHHFFTTLHHFCGNDLSAFYFDIRKDSLYCDDPNNLVRKSVRTVFNHVFNCLTAWLAPILCFTTEEAWLSYSNKSTESVHMRQFPDIPSSWKNEKLIERWEHIRTLRRVVTGAMEEARNQKLIGSSLQAHPIIYTNSSYIEAIQNLPISDIMIASDVTLLDEEIPKNAFQLDDVKNIGVVIKLAEGKKCERCWKITNEVGHQPKANDVCHRCHDVVYSQS
ncbi:MAG: isoleucine--tRNA ligase [Alphaproteobacteria bacterium]|nr:isoleucine--tRNA ligase [Alphaproteobacteria bacterium]